MLNKIRPVPQEQNVHRERMFCLLCCVAGLFAGLLFDKLKLTQSMWLGPTFFLLTLIAAFSERPVYAGGNVTVFILFFFLNEHVYASLAPGNVYPSFEILVRCSWLLLSGAVGVVLWAAKSDGIAAVCLTALAAGSQLPVVYLLRDSGWLWPLIDLAFGTALIFILQKGLKNRLAAGGLALICGVGLSLLVSLLQRIEPIYTTATLS